MDGVELNTPPQPPYYMGHELMLEVTWMMKVAILMSFTTMILTAMDSPLQHRQLGWIVVIRKNTTQLTKLDDDDPKVPETRMILLF